VEHEEESSSIGWGRALLSALIILVLGTLLLVYLPNWALTHLTSLSRNGRVAVATGTFFVLFFVIAYTLRRLQARRVL
jgi:Ca2+/Na+ antiporter